MTTRNSLLSIWFEISWIISVVLTQFNALVKTEFFTLTRTIDENFYYHSIYFIITFEPSSNFSASYKFSVDVIVPKIVNIVKNNMNELSVPRFLTTLKILPVVLNSFRVLPSFGFWHTRFFLVLTFVYWEVHNFSRVNHIEFILWFNHNTKSSLTTKIWYNIIDNFLTWKITGNFRR